MDQKSSIPNSNLETESPPKRPNEHSRLNIDEFLRISDPETQQVFVEQRA